MGTLWVEHEKERRIFNVSFRIWGLIIINETVSLVWFSDRDTSRHFCSLLFKLSLEMRTFCYIENVDEICAPAERIKMLRAMYFKLFFFHKKRKIILVCFPSGSLGWRKSWIFSLWTFIWWRSENFQNSKKMLPIFFDSKDFEKDQNFLTHGEVTLLGTKNLCKLTILWRVALLLSIISMRMWN